MIYKIYNIYKLAIKMLEDSINIVQGGNKFKIGLSFMADQLYQEATKKYELENPKALLDTD